MRRTLILALTALMLAGCVTFEEAPPRDELRNIQIKINEYQETLNPRFQSGGLNFGQVARLRPAYGKRLISESEQLRFDSWDEEYHRFKIFLADQIDAKKVTVDHAKYLDIRTANEISDKARRAGHPYWRVLW